MSCGTQTRLGRRWGSDLVLLWLWRRLVATGLIWPLAWEPPYAVGVAPKKTKGRKKKKKRLRSFWLCSCPWMPCHFFFKSRQNKIQWYHQASCLPSFCLCFEVNSTRPHPHSSCMFSKDFLIHLASQQMLATSIDVSKYSIYSSPAFIPLWFCFYLSYTMCGLYIFVLSVIETY